MHFSACIAKSCLVDVDDGDSAHIAFGSIAAATAAIAKMGSIEKFCYHYFCLYHDTKLIVIR